MKLILYTLILGLSGTVVASCPDYSGHWEGNCDSGNSISLEIKQDGCVSISLNGENLELDGVTNSQRRTNNGDVEHKTSTINWNESQSGLNMHFVTIQHFPGGHMLTNSKGKMEESGSFLSFTVKSEVDSFQNGKFTSRGQNRMLCQLSRE